MIHEIFWEYCRGGFRLKGYFLFKGYRWVSAGIQVWEQFNDHTAKRLTTIGAGSVWMARMEQSSKVR